MSRRPTAGRFVLDTNILVSAVLSIQSVPALAFLAAFERGVVLVSEATVKEMADVLNRSKFDRYVTAEERARFLAALLRQAELIEVKSDVRACRDPKDDKFLSLAVSGSASAIVSGDDDLLVLDPFQDIRILRPAAFLIETEKA